MHDSVPRGSGGECEAHGVRFRVESEIESRNPLFFQCISDELAPKIGLKGFHAMPIDICGCEKLGVSQQRMVFSKRD